MFKSFMYPEQYTDTTSMGRNGTAKTIGVEAITLDYRHGGMIVMLTPITSKGQTQNCNIDIPLSVLLEISEALKEAYPS